MQPTDDTTPPAPPASPVLIVPSLMQRALPDFDEQSREIGAGVTRGVVNWLRALPTNLFGAMLDTLAVVTISLMLVTGRTRLLAFVLSLVRPEHRPETRRVLTLMWDRLGFYLRAKLIVMA